MSDTEIKRNGAITSDMVLKTVGGLALTICSFFLNAAWTEIGALKDKNTGLETNLARLEERVNNNSRESDRQFSEIKVIITDINRKLDRLIERKVSEVKP